MSPAVEVGIRAPHSVFGEGPDAIADFARRLEASDFDRVWVGDHVSFRGGQGYDGLLQAAVLAAATRSVTVQTAVYLLPLRHPVPVARQVASVAEITPGRFVFGVGVGGDDAQEVRNSGVDPTRRGRRMDESLHIVRRLLAGDVVDHDGPNFLVTSAMIRPTPRPAVPVAVGGRSKAALRRAGRLSEGWLGLFVDPIRYAEGIAAVIRAGGEAGRGAVPWRHGLLVWCGLGDDRTKARSSVAPPIEGLYQLPFDRFEKYVPYGTPAHVAEALIPFVDAGASYLLLSPVAADPKQALEGAAEVRRLLRRSEGQRSGN